MNARLFVVFALVASTMLLVLSQLQLVAPSVQSAPLPNRVLHSEAAYTDGFARGRESDGTLEPRPSEPLAATSTNGENVKLVGHIGGASNAVFVHGNYAYVGHGAEMAILDISDHAHPVKIGYVVLPDLVLDIDVSGSYAYVAARTTGLRIVDISNVTSPIEVGSYDTPGESQSVEVVNSLAYVGDDARGLRIIDVSQPTHPIEVGAYDTPGLAKHVTVSNGYAYIADFEAGLWIVDVANPRAPVLVSGFDTPWYTNYVFVAGHLAYVLDAHSGLLILDVSNPAAPRRLSRIDIGEVARELTLVGQTVYEFDAENGLHVIDVTNPSAPVQIGSYYMTGVYNGVVADGYAYLSQWNEGKLTILDLTTPTLPINIGSFDDPGYGWALAVTEHYAYATNSMTLTVIDISDPGQPTAISQIDMPLVPLDWTAAMGTAGHYLYVGDEVGLHVVDVSTPADPIRIGDDPSYGGVRDLAVLDNRLYMTVQDGSLRIADITTPTAPSLLGSYPEQNAWRLAVAGRYAFVSDGVKLDVVDILTPTFPTLTGTYTVPGYMQGIAVSGAYVYLVDGTLPGLRIVTVADPSRPTEIGSYRLSGDPWAVAISSHYAYVADARRRLTVLDVSNPMTPTKAGYYELSTPADQSSFTWRVDVRNGYAFVPDNAFGLYILQFGSMISGHVVDVNRVPFADVQVVSNSGQTVTTNAAGTFTFATLLTGTYIFTPTRYEYSFWPASRTISVPPDAEYQDFIILPAPVSITLMPSTTNMMLTYTDTQGLTTQLDFSANVVTQTTMLFLTPTVASPATGFAFAGHAFDLIAAQVGESPTNFTFNAPVTVTVHYSDYDVRLVTDETQLALWWWNGNEWWDVSQTCEPASTYVRDVTSHVLSIPICSTGRFGLFGPTRQTFMPISMRNWQ
jgi:hypothetical protein